MKKILLYILIFTTITGGLFGIFGGVNNEENKSSILGVDEVYALTCYDDDTGDIAPLDAFGECPDDSTSSKELLDAEEERRVEREEGAAAEGSTLDQYGITCSLWKGFDMGSCITTYAFVFQNISTIVFHGSALLFNKTLAFSMDSSIIDQQFVKTTWGATRGFANMLFILVLVVISISIILNVGQFANRQLIVRVVIIALAVNFSLFASRIIIDAGNIIALGFYDAIQADYEGKDKPSDVDKTIKEKDISGAIVQGFNPTVMFGPDSFIKWRDTNQLSRTSSNAMLSVVFFMSAGILLYTAYIFFMASFVFVVRIAWLWILMALAPLAFISYTIPQLESYWKDWWKQLVNRSFAIVVFMFLMWLTLTIVSSDFLDSAFGVVSGEGGAIKTGGSIVDFMVIIFMQFAVVIALLRLTLSATKKMSDDGGAGKILAGFGKMATAAGIGLATGGASLVAGAATRQVVGGVGSYAAGKIKSSQEKGGVMSGTLGRMALRGAKGVGDYKFGTKEGYIKQKERVVGEEKTMVKQMKSIKLPDGTVTTDKAKIEEEYYKRQQSRPMTYARRAAGVAAIAVTGGLATPLAVAMGNRTAGENKAFMDYKEKRGFKKELYREEDGKKVGLKEDLKKLDTELSSLQNEERNQQNKKMASDSPVVKNTKKRIEAKRDEVEAMKGKIEEKEEKIKELEKIPKPEGEKKKDKKKK